MGLLQGKKGTHLLGIYLDIERDFGRFLLVRTFNNEVPGDSVAVKRRVSRCLNQVGDALQQGIKGLLV